MLYLYMRFILCLLIAIVTTSCGSKRLAIDSFTKSGGVYISSVDSSVMKENNIVHLSPTSIAVGFSGKFAKSRFASAPWVRDSLFFTPDTGLMKRIDNEINEHYCSAIKAYYKEKNFESIADMYCKLWEKNCKYYDKQYIGYISNEGDKSLYIKLIDFREDPNHLKPYFTSSWIDGWHGWFNSNVITLRFNLDKNSLYL